MPDPSDSQPTPNFERSLAELETIVHQLEDGELGLADALARYEQGVKLLKECYGSLERAERRIELLTGVDADGNPVVQPFEDSDSADLETKGQSRSRRRSTTTAKRAPKPVEDVEEGGTSGVLF